MKKTVLGFVVLLSATVANAASITVQDVSVLAGSGVYNAAFVGWSLPVFLDSGQALVLAQDHQGGANDSTSYNFDLSDFANSIATVQITVNGITQSIPDVGQILTAKETPETCCYNEAHGFVTVYSDDLYSVLFGYADNVHGGPNGCGSFWAGIEGVNTAPNCVPNPFTNADVFMGTPALLQSGAWPYQCEFGQPCAWDTPVIAVVANRGRSVDPNPVPEPASLLLLGGGLFVVVALLRKKEAKKI